MRGGRAEGGRNELRRVVWRSEDVVVGDGEKLEGTSDAKQWPLELTVCDVGDEQNTTDVRY